MAHYIIKSDVCLGISHSGPVNVEGKSTVDLNMDDVSYTVSIPGAIIKMANS